MLVFARDESAIYHGDIREGFSLLLEETISDLISDQLMIVSGVSIFPQNRVFSKTQYSGFEFFRNENVVFNENSE